MALCCYKNKIQRAYVSSEDFEKRHHRLGCRSAQNSIFYEDTNAAEYISYFVHHTTSAPLHIVLSLYTNKYIERYISAVSHLPSTNMYELCWWEELPPYSSKSAHDLTCLLFSKGRYSEPFSAVSRLLNIPAKRDMLAGSITSSRKHT
jgi:hypothetical protein